MNIRNQGLFGIGSTISKMVAIACCLPACTVIYFDSDGSRRVVGLSDVQVTPADRSSGLTGDVVTIRTVGLTLNMIRANPELAIGYYHGVLGLLHDFGLSPTPKRPRLDSPRRPAAIDRGYAFDRALPGNGTGFLGLVDVTINSTDTVSTRAGKFGNSQVLGVGFAQQPQGLDFTVGYSGWRLLTIEHDVVVKLGRR